GACSVSPARAHVQVTAAVAARLQGIGGELEAGGLEGAVVHAAGDATEGGDVGVGHARLLPRLLQRTALQGDVERRRIAAVDAGREHPSVVGDAADECVTQPGEIRRAIARELTADLTA